MPRTNETYNHFIRVKIIKGNDDDDSDEEIDYRWKKKVGNAGTSRSSREVFAPRNKHLISKDIKGCGDPVQVLLPLELMKALAKIPWR